MALSGDDNHPSSSDSIYSNVEDKLNALRLRLSHLSQSGHDFEEQFNEISEWINKQKVINIEKQEQLRIAVEDVDTALTATINGIEEFENQETQEITTGVLNIISSLAELVGRPYTGVIGPLCSIIGALLTISKPYQPSVVDQLAQVVHNELVHFNKRLQDDKYHGLRHRVSDQRSQLRTMKRGEKLDDPNLLNDYVQFMGELSNRIESPLPFKYEENLTKDSDVADFVTAVVTYCEAYCCFMALLFAAKGKFAELGHEYKQDENAVDRKISSQRKNAKEKLSFLSEEKYLTFLGRLPSEGGKLTKIVVLSRNMHCKSLVEAVRGSLGLPEMPDLATVESAATKVSCQSVKLKVEKYPIPGAISISEDVWPWDFAVQFINETNFPMKVVSYRTKPGNDHLQFVEVVQPHAAYQHLRSSFYRHATPSTFGYLILYPNQDLNGILSSDTNPPAEDARVIEFAWSANGFVFNIQDKTNDEFSYGRDTYNTMNSGKAKTLYWFEHGVHYMARGEIVATSFGFLVVRFIIQDFDPFDVQD